MDKSSKDKVLDNYTLLNKKDYVKYKDKYPGLKDESLYELNTKRQRHYRWFKCYFW